MKNALRLVVAILTLSFAGWAGPIECVSGSLQSYIDLQLDGCTIGDKRLFDFQPLEIPGAATPIPVANIIVNPIIDVPLNAGLSFVVDTAAGPGEFLDARFGFRIQVLPGGIPIRGLQLDLMGASATGDGAVTTISQDLIAFQTAFDSQTTARSTFPPVVDFAVINDIGMDGGLAGSASLFSADSRFSQVPEPGTWALLSLSLTGLWVLRVTQKG